MITSTPLQPTVTSPEPGHPSQSLLSSQLLPKIHLLQTERFNENGKFLEAIAAASKGIALEGIDPETRAAFLIEQAVAYYNTSQWDKVKETAIEGIFYTTRINKIQTLAKLHFESTRNMPEKTIPSLTPYYAALGKSDLGQIAILLTQSRKRINEREPITGETALIAASSSDENLTTIKYLVGMGADTRVANRLGETALMNAIRSRAINAVHFLLSQEDSLTTTNRLGETLLMIACEEGHVDIVRILLRHYKCNKDFLNQKSEIDLTAEQMTENPVILELLKTKKEELSF